MPARWAAVAAVAAAVGCSALIPHRRVDTPIEAGYDTADLIDPTAQQHADQFLTDHDLCGVADRFRGLNRPPALPPRRTVLVLSGGGTYGAYTAGVLCGWTETGTRPCFDVVTGISTGALIAPMAFLGPKYDGQMRELYTTLRNKDVYHLKGPVRSLLSQSLADNSRLVTKVNEIVTADILAEVAAEHRKGRRLYVGTTEVEGSRQVVWDLGAIACGGTEADLGVFRKVLLGSASIPGFFPPQELPVTVDGKPYTELHVDGGTTTALFFRPPWVPPELRHDPVYGSLYGTDVFAIVAGKLYPDPAVYKLRSLRIAAHAVSTVIYAQALGDLARLNTICILTGMNFFLTAIPRDFPAPASSTDFDPAEMQKMFDEGVRQMRQGTAWRRKPPGTVPGETPLERAGTALVHAPHEPNRGVAVPEHPFGYPRSPHGIPAPPIPLAK